jgi:hypothetical protein
MMAQKRIRYDEGQWFAIPLRNGGYALGIIVRGSYKTKGGLGYFFGPKFQTIPDDKDTLDKQPEDAVLITQFGDMGLVNGSWPLIHSSRQFLKDEWPIPKFGIKLPNLPGKGFVREYVQNVIGELILKKETLVDQLSIINLPVDRISGGGAVEIRLTDLIEKD